ncbi:MAG: ABC transporter substrate-binding protein [Acidimicrobiia bacterium]
MRHVFGSRHRSGVVAIAVVSAIVLAACGSSSKSTSTNKTPNTATPTTASALDLPGSPLPGLTADTSKPVEGGNVTFAVDSETTGGWCLPEAELAINGIQVARAMYDYLTVPDASGGYVPFLADKITSNAAYTQWTIHLRSGITFSDGTPFNAQDVVDNLDAYRGTFPDRHPLLFIFVFQDITSVTATNNMTVQVDMKTPWASFPAHLYQYGRLGMMGERQLRDGKNCASDMVGTGPFMLKQWIPNDQLVVVKNPHYWRRDQYGQQLPYLNQITFKPVTDGSVLLNGLNSKTYDLANTDDTTTVIPALLPEAKSGSIGLAIATANPETAYTIFNTSKVPFNNILAREAYVYAYNTTLYNRLRQDSLNQVADGPFGPNVLGFLPSTGFPGYNLTKAKALVAQYKTQTGQALSFTLSIPNDSASEASAEVVVGMMSAAGIKMGLHPEEQSQEINDVIAGSFQGAAWRNHPGFDPDTQWVWWHCGVAPAIAAAPAPPSPNLGPATALGPVGNNCDNAVNFSKFNDPVINHDLEVGRTSTVPSVRKAAYQGINIEFAKEVWEGWGYWSVWTIPYQTDVHGILGPNLPTATSPNVVNSSPNASNNSQPPYTGLASGDDVSGLWLS